MSLSPLQYLISYVIVMGWIAMVVMAVLAISFFVRMLGERARIKAAPTKEQRETFYETYVKIVRNLGTALGTLAITALVELLLTITLISDLTWWNGYTTDSALTLAAAITLITLIISGLSLVVLLSARPWRSYKDTVWALRDEKPANEASSEEEVATGTEEPVSA